MTTDCTFERLCLNGVVETKRYFYLNEKKYNKQSVKRGEQEKKLFRDLLTDRVYIHSRHVASRIFFVILGEQIFFDLLW